MNKILALFKKVFLGNNFKIFVIRCLIEILAVIYCSKICVWLLAEPGNNTQSEIIFFVSFVIFSLGMRDSEGVCILEPLLPKYKING